MKKQKFVHFYDKSSKKTDALGEVFTIYYSLCGKEFNSYMSNSENGNSDILSHFSNRHWYIDSIHNSVVSGNDFEPCSSCVLLRQVGK